MCGGGLNDACVAPPAVPRVGVPHAPTSYLHRGLPTGATAPSPLRYRYSGFAFAHAAIASSSATLLPYMSAS
jgi:hypothetical protein